MSYKQMTGNIISATKVEPDGFYQDSAASGVWNLQDQYDYRRGGNWPTSGNAQRGFFATFEAQSGSKTIKSINLSTTGNDGSDWADLHTVVRNGGVGQCSSSTRAIVFMGIVDATNARVNNIQYYNMITAGDGADFGDATTAAYNPGSLSNGTGGMYPVADASTASPQDWIMLGIADDGADISGAIAEITSKADLQTYLTNMASANSWTDVDPDDHDATVAFNAAAHAQRVWDDLDTLNG